MHIAVVHRDLHHTTRGGIARLYIELARRYVNAGNRVTFVTQECSRLFVDDSIGFVCLPRTEDLDQHRSNVASVLEELQPDIVECSSWEAEALAYAVQKKRCPVVVRGEVSARTMGASQELIDAEEKLFRHADQLLAVSEWASCDLVRSYGIDPPKVIPNGVNSAIFQPDSLGPPEEEQGWFIEVSQCGEVKPIRSFSLRSYESTIAQFGDKVSIIWVGKITTMKGWDLLVDFSARLADIAIITVVLGHSRPYCKVGDTSRLIMVQDLDDKSLVKLYQRSDYCLSTSRWEGFGLAILEAIACGIVALVPHTLGTASELLTSGGGLTYSSCDDLRRILVNRLGSNVQWKPAKHSWDLNASNSLKIFAETIAKALPGRQFLS